MKKLIALILITGTTNLDAQITTPCRDSSQYAQHIVDYIKEMATSSDTAEASSRVMVGLPSNPIPDSLVKIVVNDSICNAAVASITVAHQAPSQTSDPHEVLKLGPYYAVWRKETRSGEYLPIFFLDSQMNFLSSLLK